MPETVAAVTTIVTGTIPGQTPDTASSQSQQPSSPRSATPDTDEEAPPAKQPKLQPLRFPISMVGLKLQLDKLNCADKGGLEDTLLVLPCGHHLSADTAPVATKTSTGRKKKGRCHRAPGYICAQPDCQQYCTASKIRTMAYPLRTRELVKEIFSPKARMPDFSHTQATELFEAVCRKIDGNLRPIPCTDKNVREKVLSAQTKRAATSVTQYLAWWNSTYAQQCSPEHSPTTSSTEEPVRQQPAEIPPPRERMFMACPYQVNSHTKPHSLPLPGEFADVGRLVITHDIAKHQKYFHVDRKTHFVEYLPNTSQGTALAKQLERAAEKGLRFSTQRPPTANALFLNWNPAIPVHDDRNKPFEKKHLTQLAQALNQAMYEQTAPS